VVIANLWKNDADSLLLNYTFMIKLWIKRAKP